MVAVPCRDLCNLGLESEPRTLAGFLLSVRHFPLHNLALLTLPGQGTPSRPAGLTADTARAGGLPRNMWGRGELPVDVAGLKAEILVKQPWLGPQGRRGEQPSSNPQAGPAPHCRPPNTAPRPLAGLLPGLGKVGMHREAHPKGGPGTTSHSHLRKVPRLQPPAPPAPVLASAPAPAAQGPRPATTRGSLADSDPVERLGAGAG